MSIRTLKNLEAEGKLHPRRDRRVMTNGVSREVVVYDPQEVGELAIKRAFLIRARMSGQASEGEIAARAFEYYGEGLSVVDVVTRLRIAPRAADELREQWERMGGVEMVLHPAAREELARLLGGSFDGVSGLIGRLRERLASLGVSMPTAETASLEGARASPLAERDVDSSAGGTG